MRGENFIHRGEREIREVLVVNRIELIFVHQTNQGGNSIVITPFG